MLSCQRGLDGGHSGVAPLGRSRVSLPGRLFVLESPITFSAGIVDVAYLKQAGGERVTLVGGADATYRFQTPTAER